MVAGLHILELSDIHLDHYQDVNYGIDFINSLRPQEPADVLILAGDIWSLKGEVALRYLDAFRHFAVEILYVPGNHEWYDVDPTKPNKLLNKLKESGLRVLGPDHLSSFTYKDQHFVGSTMWYPNNEKVRYQLQNWSDAVYIKRFAYWWPEYQTLEQRLLYEQIKKDSIVITHMLPTWLAVSPQYAGDSTNVLYVHDMEDLIIERKPKLWFHGHSHERLDYDLADTRLIRNPIGYPSPSVRANAKLFSIVL